ncbi:TPA: hypothetical protein ACOAXB_002511 [Enterococcus faecalis]
MFVGSLPDGDFCLAVQKLEFDKQLPMGTKILRNTGLIFFLFSGGMYIYITYGSSQSHSVAKSKGEYQTLLKENDYVQLIENAYMYSALKKTKLKEMHIVRYADDFKIFTNTPKSVIKIFHAVKGYLRKQLSLDISKEKSK